MWAPLFSHKTVNTNSRTSGWECFGSCWMLFLWAWGY